MKTETIVVIAVLLAALWWLNKKTPAAAAIGETQWLDPYSVVSPPTNVTPKDIADMAGGLLPNPKGFTIGDALVLARIQQGLTVSDAARARLTAKL